MGTYGMIVWTGYLGCIVEGATGSGAIKGNHVRMARLMPSAGASSNVVIHNTSALNDGQLPKVAVTFYSTTETDSCQMSRTIRLMQYKEGPQTSPKHISYTPFNRPYHDDDQQNLTQTIVENTQSTYGHQRQNPPDRSHDLSHHRSAGIWHRPGRRREPLHGTVWSVPSVNERATPAVRHLQSHQCY